MIFSIVYWDKLVKLGFATIEAVDDPDLPNTIKGEDGCLYQYILLVPEEELNHVLLTEQAYTLNKIYKLLVGVFIASIAIAVLAALINSGFLRTIL